MAESEVPTLPVEVEVIRLGDVHIGYWRFGVYLGDTIPWGADGITDPRSGAIMIGEHLPEHHRWPVLAHEYFEAVTKVWAPSLDITHDQIQILGESLAHSFPDLVRLWWQLASETERRELLEEFIGGEDDGRSELAAGGEMDTIRSREASVQSPPPKEEGAKERLYPSES